MQIIEFRYMTKRDSFDDSFPHWSRKYEYPTVFQTILKCIPDGKRGNRFTYHNSSWGFDVEHHQRFKNVLENAFGVDQVDNSDIKDSPEIRNCFVMDITHKDAVEQFKNNYDFVINISAIEEIPGDHMSHLENLYTMVKPGGYLICTFDYPGIQLPENVKQLIDQSTYEERIHMDGRQWGGPPELNVLLMVVRKDDDGFVFNTP